MSEQINDGGPAFPDPGRAQSAKQREVLTDTGMTLRDWFAGQELSKTHGTHVCDVPMAYDRLADHCYRMADAMLRAREQQS